MFATALIVFREMLEAALIVTILLAATRGVTHRSLWISFGIAGGMAGAGAVAASTNFISSLFEGAGQEIVNAIILFAAVALIGWHVVWMNLHGRQMAADMRSAGQRIADGERHMSALALVVGLAVMREGSEVVLMLQGLLASGEAHTLLIGAAVGCVGGILASCLMYAGFVAMPVARIFSLTNVLLILIASGMAARGANFLTQAGLVPSFGNQIWDTDSLLSEQSIAGQILSALVGYMSRPSGIEILFYAATAIIIFALMRRAKLHLQHMTAPITVIILVALFAAPQKAEALEVLSPYVTQEIELEHQGYVAHDRNPETSNEQSYVAAIGISPLPFYKVEFEGEFEREAGSDHDARYSSFNIENTFMLTEPGEYWIDSGLFYEMDFARTGPNTITFGYLGAKEIGGFLDTANLLAYKDYGSGNGPMGFIYSNQLKYQYRSYFEPGFEIFGDTKHKERFDDQQLTIGPGIFGKIYTFNGQGIKYQLAALLGATTATPDWALRWKLEYEFAF